MSVRHVNAAPGEYIAVHRRYNRNVGVSHSSGSNDDSGCLVFLACILGVWLIVEFWKLLVALAIMGVSGWLIWIFRRPIWTSVCWIFTKLVFLCVASCKWMGKWYSRKKLSRNHETIPGNDRRGQPDYGKIRQHHQ